MRPSLHRPGLLLSGLALLAAAPVSAQIRVPGTPAARESALPGDVPTVSVATPDVEALRFEDQWREQNGIPGPLRFGAPIPVDVTPDNAGRWDVAADGTLVWRVRFESPGAHSLGLELASYRLPVGAQLFVYDDALETVYGAYDHTQHNLDPGTGELGPIGIEPFPGDAVVLEYKQPAGVEGGPDLVVGHVVHDYRDVFELERRLDQEELQTHSGDGGGVTGGCTVHAACSQFDAWGLQKRATMRSINFGGLCSASLINNTANDGTQLVYTANHCNQGPSVTFRFKYMASSCAGGGAPSTNNVSGATNLATDQESDGRLMRINPNIQASYDEYYNGWDRGAVNPTFGLSFHHPGGSPMMGMIDNNGGLKGQVNFAGIGLVKIWAMNSQVGGTEGGSSGGPLFDQNLRTIGALTGGPASCFISDFGRFHVFWDNTNISNHLDPTGSGALTTDGHDPNGGPPPACGTTKYGTGLGGANIGVLNSTSSGITGTSYTITATGFNGNGTCLLAVSASQTAVPALGGTLLVNVGSALTVLNMPIVAGAGVLVIPSLPAAGLTGNFFGGMADGSQPFGWALTDGLSLTICP